MQNRAQILDNAASVSEVTLMRFLKFRGKTSKKLFFSVEGSDDVTFYQTIVHRISPQKSSEIAYFDCKGKENVLNLIPLIEENIEVSINHVWFFVDRDYDDLRGHVGHRQLWMTPTYSFENMLVSQRILEFLLEGEFRCSGYDGVVDIENIKSKFEKLLQDYRREMFLPNLCAYYAVKRGIRLNPQDEIITPNIQVGVDSVKLGLTKEEIFDRLPKDAIFSTDEVELTKDEFSELEPESRWRGKFIFNIFIKFVSELKRDRGSAAPIHFSARNRMTFNPSTDPIRALASMAEIPVSLSDLISKV